LLNHSSRGVRRLVLAAAIALAIAPMDAPAAEEAAETWHYETWNTLMSPYCPGRTLLDCPSGQATELREWIAAQEKAGRTQKEVEDELYAQFGDVILQAPKASGFGLAAYVIPVVGVVLGALFLFVFLRRQSVDVPPSPPLAGAPPPDPELDRLIDEEMQRR
jgi:cytochrome c-type biogenesis protein CcmH/NrfF